MSSTPTPPPVADWVTIPDLYRDPFPIYDRLRAEGGIHWVPAVGRYLISSYAAVHETELDQETYSANEEGSLQIRAMGHSMLRRDDPEHYIERKAWQPVLRPGAVKRLWTGMFEKNANRYLDEMIAKGPGADLIWDFAAPYAAECLREIIGLHNATQQDLQRWSQTMIDATGNYADDPEVWRKGKQSFDEVDAALDEMIPWHTKNPDHSLISSLLASPADMLPLERIRANIKMTIGGGLNEPRDALGVTAWAVLKHPDQQAALQADPALWPAAFEESLRWISPIGMYSRQTTREVELAGVTLPRGAKLGICILSANRDTNVWPDAEQFDFRRDLKPHVAFGKGVHVCLGTWVARSQVAGVGLPLLFERLPGISLVPEDPAELGGWVFRGMTRMPVQWEQTHSSSTPDLHDAATDPALSIAVIGSGPSGCFSAQALLRAFPSAAIDVLEQLPVPFGLVRYGVAADHQGTKSVARQFDRLFAEDRVRFIGNATIDQKRLAELRDIYDVVVVATGMSTDRLLPIPGGDAAGVVGAGALTRYLNAHPTQPEIGSLGSEVVIVGHGNVALDVVRLLAKSGSELQGSDLDADLHAQVASEISTIHVVGRSSATGAKFDPVMMRELSMLFHAEHVIHGVNFDSSAAGKDARLDAVHDLVQRSARAPKIRIEWWFGYQPQRLEVDGDGHVTAAVFSDGTGEHSLPADSIVTAIGFGADGRCPLPDEQRSADLMDPGFYTAGWLRRGPTGAIPDQRADARALARLVTEHVAEGSIRVAGRTAAVDASAIQFDGWRRIDLVESMRAPEMRVRKKLRGVTEMLEIGADLSIVLPSLAHTSNQSGDGGTPITVLFGTESGGGELVADDLRRHLSGRADVIVRDLAEVDPATLDTDRFHVVICSTYGDGELPENAKKFHRALQEAPIDLSSLTYAVFGMGDRSYTRTYSRGSELLDEALAARGARRVGEYGRHDAAGPVDATEIAMEWIDGVIAEITARTLTA